MAELELDQCDGVRGQIGAVIEQVDGSSIWTATLGDTLYFKECSVDQDAL